MTCGKLTYFRFKYYAKFKNRSDFISVNLDQIRLKILLPCKLACILVYVRAECFVSGISRVEEKRRRSSAIRTVPRTATNAKPKMKSNWL